MVECDWKACHEQARDSSASTAQSPRIVGRASELVLEASEGKIMFIEPMRSTGGTTEGTEEA